MTTLEILTLVNLNKNFGVDKTKLSFEDKLLYVVISYFLVSGT